MPMLSLPEIEALADSGDYAGNFNVSDIAAATILSAAVWISNVNNWSGAGPELTDDEKDTIGAIIGEVTENLMVDVGDQYVKKSGDEMTGRLIIDPPSSADRVLYVQGISTGIWAVEFTSRINSSVNGARAIQLDPQIQPDTAGLTQTGIYNQVVARETANDMAILEGSLYQVVIASDYTGDIGVIKALRIASQSLQGPGDVETSHALTIDDQEGAGTNYSIETKIGDISLMASGSDKFGVYGATPVVQPTVTGINPANAALASLLEKLEEIGLIIDATTGFPP